MKLGRIRGNLNQMIEVRARSAKTGQQIDAASLEVSYIPGYEREVVHSGGRGNDHVGLGSRGALRFELPPEQTCPQGDLCRYGEQLARFLHESFEPLNP